MFLNFESSNKIIRWNKTKVTCVRGYLTQIPQSSKLTCVQKGCIFTPIFLRCARRPGCGATRKLRCPREMNHAVVSDKYYRISPQFQLIPVSQHHLTIIRQLCRSQLDPKTLPHLRPKSITFAYFSLPLATVYKILTMLIKLYKIK